MRKVLAIARREYEAAVRTKAFIITLVVMPIMMIGSVVVQLLLEDQVDVTDRRVAIIDYTGQLYGVLADEAEQRNSGGIYGKVDAPEKPELPGLPEALGNLVTFNAQREELGFRGPMTLPQRDRLLGACRNEDDRNRITELYEKSQKQVLPRYLLETVEAGNSSPDELRIGLKQRVENGELFAFVEIAEDVIEGGPEATDPPIVYYTARTTYRDLRNWMARPINDVIRQTRMADADLDAEQVAWVTQYTHPRIRHVRSLDATGAHIAGKETNEAADLLMPASLMMLLFMVIMVGASPLVHSVLEEKMQRISEVLVASIAPFQLMLGKLVGVVGVSLTITGVYLVGGYLTARHFELHEYLTPVVLSWFIVYQALAIVMFGSLFIAIGAACSDVKESQSSLMPVMLLVCLPLFCWINVAKEPTSAFATGMSLFPPATPMLMVLRMSAAPEIAIWQPLLGVVLVLLTTLLCVWAAGRIFRVGILMQGKGAKFGEMLRWVVRG